jgi:enoyl-CoA hydratase
VAHLTLTEHDGVSVLTADRPPANAMDLTLLDELVAAVEGLAAEPPAALVLAGRPGFFSAGLDLKAVPGYGPPEQRRLVDGINRMAIGVYGLPCPVVCAITGHAIAGGFVLAVCGDHRVASTEGRYGLTEVKVGVPYPQGAIGVVRAELTASAARLLAHPNACGWARSTKRSRPTRYSAARWRWPASWPRCPPRSTPAPRPTCAARS